MVNIISGGWDVGIFNAPVMNHEEEHRLSLSLFEFLPRKHVVGLNMR